MTRAAPVLSTDLSAATPLRTARLGVITALALAIAGCSDGAAADAPLQPRDGTWEGADLSFVVAAGVVLEVVAAKAACTDEDGTTTSYGGPITGSSPASPLLLESADHRITGAFSSATLAAGTLRLGSEAAPCRVIGAWTASWQAPLTGGGVGPGSPDWQGASVGTVHPGPARPAPAARSEPAARGAGRLAALSRLDAVRAQVGLAPLQADAAAGEAAQAHAAFYVAHAASYQAQGVSPHDEVASFGVGFTGVSFAARMKAAGYAGQPAAEVMAFTGSGPAAVDGWMETVYHRLPLLDPRAADVGVGVAAAGKFRTEVMVFGAGAGAPPAPPWLVYPVPGQQGVPRSWAGNEGPQPPPPPAGYPSGPVITAHLPAGTKVVAHSLRDGAGGEVAHVWLDASNDSNLKAFDPQAVALYAHKPLAAATRYHVRLELEHKGAAASLAWSFDTAP